MLLIETKGGEKKKPSKIHKLKTGKFSSLMLTWVKISRQPFAYMVLQKCNHNFNSVTYFLLF